MKTPTGFQLLTDQTVTDPGTGRGPRCGEYRGVRLRSQVGDRGTGWDAEVAKSLIDQATKW